MDTLTASDNIEKVTSKLESVRGEINLSWTGYFFCLTNIDTGKIYLDNLKEVFKRRA